MLQSGLAYAAPRESKVDKSHNVSKQIKLLKFRHLTYLFFSVCTVSNSQRFFSLVYAQGPC